MVLIGDKIARVGKYLVDAKDTHQTIVGNIYDRYNSKNPIVRVLMSCFLRCFDDLFKECWDPHSVLEVE